jgi:hypothetical protein
VLSCSPCHRLLPGKGGSLESPPPQLGSSWSG